MKKGIDKAVSEIKKYFPDLFDEGYKIVATKYDENNFGNWIIVLHSNKSGIRIMNDRRQIVVLIGPPWALANLEKTDHYYDMKIIIAFLEKGSSVDFNADLQHMELQYEKINQQLHVYYQQIIQLVNSPDFENIEKELHLLYKNILAKNFPRLFEKRS